MIARKLLFLSILAVGILLTGTRGHASHVDFGRGTADQTEFSSIIVQPVGSTLFSFQFHTGDGRRYGYGHRYGYRRHHHGYYRGHRYYGHGYYYDRYHYGYKDRGYSHSYKHRRRPHSHYNRYGGPYYRSPRNRYQEQGPGLITAS